MGRRKIEIQPITHERNRSVTFLKRKNGLFKKAYELGVLCSVDVAIIIFNPAGTSNKLFEFTSTDLDSLIRRRAEFGGERDLKTPIDFSHDGARPSQGKGNGIGGDSDEDEDDSDVPVSGSKSAAQSNKRRVSGTKSRPARNGALSSLQEEKPDIDELEHDTALSHSTAQRSPNPQLQVNNASDDERECDSQEHRRAESSRSTTGGGHRDQSTQDGRGGESWPSPRSSNRQLPGGYSSAHDLLMSASGSSVLGNLGLPFSLGHLASQLTPQQLSTLGPHLSALASQQQLNSLSPQHQELLALHAVKQQQQQLHLQQREQLASIQNSLRGAPNRLATLNLNLSGLGNLGNFGGMGGLSNLASLSGLGGDRDLGSLGLGSSLTGLPIRKMPLGASNFTPGLTSVSSSGTSGSSGAHSHGNSSASFNHPSLSNNGNFNSNGNASHEQTPTMSNDDSSWLDFLSLPGARIDPASLNGLGPLSSLSLGGLVDRDRDRESAVRGSSGQSDSASSLFGMPFGSGGGSSGNNTVNAAYGSGVASGGGYGLGVGLGHETQERRGTPLERSVSRGESMDVDKDSAKGEREQERRGRSAERVETEREDENQSRKRPRWE